LVLKKLFNGIGQNLVRLLSENIFGKQNMFPAVRTLHPRFVQYPALAHIRDNDGQRHRRIVGIRQFSFPADDFQFFYITTDQILALPIGILSSFKFHGSLISVILYPAFFKYCFIPFATALVALTLGGTPGFFAAVLNHAADDQGSSI
jgi:hypothetical protein